MELKSDWEAASKLTDEETEAAIASDPDEAGMDDWLEEAIIIRPGDRNKLDGYIAAFMQKYGDEYLEHMDKALKGYIQSHSA